jgi:penicillin-binding protein 1A
MARRFGITTPITTVPSMVLGTSEVRLIDMVHAFASVSAKGSSIEPYGILKVKTADGDVLYEHKDERSHMLVPQYVAAGITDLLQSAVAIGTGKEAQIGRPVAGKTGTTSSNKDGWFLGFSSGITTGVWMGRDDAKPVPGLHGGSSPARAFAAYMRYAVKDRPVEEFDTKLKLPDWQLEPDDEYLQSDPDNYYFVDEDGNLIAPGRSEYVPAPEPDLGQPGYYYGRNSASPDQQQQGQPQQLQQQQPKQQQQQPRPPQAAGDDFIDRAIGRGSGAGAAQDPGLRAAPPAPGSNSTSQGRAVIRRVPPDLGTAPSDRTARPPVQNAP